MYKRQERRGQLCSPRARRPGGLPGSGVIAVCDREWFGAEIPGAGIAGDQQAATFGQACFTPGMVKNTYGTGCFMLMNTGATATPSTRGLLTTIAWDNGGGTTFALEGSIFMAGAITQWLRDGLGIIKSAGEIEALAASVRDSGGVYMAVSFNTLLPHQDGLDLLCRLCL